MKKLIFISMILFVTLGMQAQMLTQTIRGQIKDKQTKTAVTGATVVLANSDPVIATATNSEGEFILESVPVGRHEIIINSIGYESLVISNLIVSSAKELVLDIEMNEDVTQIEEIIVNGKSKKDPSNESATVSARSFTIEETDRYAGSRMDPARMATNYAGVVAANDERNDIIIRGNSPTGLLWKLEGINIPNPGHFATNGTTGGAVSILNNNNLANSDFFTGAFPAEYGNALSGVFDLRLRKGNNRKHEFMGQFSLQGTELGAEGPLGKKTNNSYMLNYRYSTISILDKLKLMENIPAIPKYQDIVFKVDLPGNRKTGHFSLFGIGGKSIMDFKFRQEEDDDYDIHDQNENLNSYLISDMAVAGLSHQKLFSDRTYVKIVAAFTGINYGQEVDTILSDTEKLRIQQNKSIEKKLVFSSFLNHKFNKRNHLKAGISADYAMMLYSDSILDQTNNTFRKILSTEENYGLLQAFGQWQHKISNDFVINEGIHVQYLTMNNTYSVEPRLGLLWKINKKHSLSFGSGMHSQIQPMVIYNYEKQSEDGTYIKTNRDLDMSKSIHVIAGYDYSPAKNLRIKFEPYYQYLYNIPVEKEPSVFSAVNIGADYELPVIHDLVNEGTGENYGLDLTIEKFFSNNFYFLMTGSIFESKYSGSDGIERNTVYNGNFVFNALGGVEFKTGKNSALQIDAKVATLGNRRYIPIDLPASDISGYPVYNEEQAFENRYKDYFRADLKVSFRWNRKKTTHYIAYDFVNLLNTQNVYAKVYNPKINDLSTMYQYGMIPNFIYRIEF